MLLSIREGLMEHFTELKSVYRSRLDFPNGKSFISNSSFDNYLECFNYAKAESKKYSFCGFCVISCDEPNLDFPIIFGDNEENAK